MGKKIVFFGDYDINLRLSFFKFLQKNDFDIFVFTTSENTKQELISNDINTFLYKLPRSIDSLINIPSFAENSIKIVKNVKYINPDIIHIFDTIPNLYVRPLLFFLKKPIISTIPGLGYIYSEDLYKFRKKIYNFLQKFLSKFSKYIVFQNEDDMKLFIENNIIPKEKAKIILSSGIDLNKFSKSSINKSTVIELKNKFNIQTDSINFLLASRLIKYKGIQEYLEASKYIKEQYKNQVNFFIVGKSDKSNKGFDINIIKKYRKHVKYVGYIKDIRELIHLCDVVVLPSYYREGVPRILLEAAALEKPIITTNVPGCKETVINGFNGILIPPKNIKALINAIEFFIKNKDKINSFGKNSRQIVETKFDAKKIFLEYIKIYNGIYEL